MQTITTHYINGRFVESHGNEVMDIIKPTNRRLIGRVTMADRQDTKDAIGAAKNAFATFGRSTKEDRIEILHRLHQAASARVDELTGRWSRVRRDGSICRAHRPVWRERISSR